MQSVALSEFVLDGGLELASMALHEMRKHQLAGLETTGKRAGVVLLRKWRAILVYQVHPERAKVAGLLNAHFCQEGIEPSGDTISILKRPVALFV
jgi:hypothetical protein